jgi:hypothetical protein
MSETPIDVREFNVTICAAHNKHFENSEYGLVNPNESPNGNIIYHLYSDGEITSQKGGWAYLQRSEFSDWYNPDIPSYDKVAFNFPKKANNNYTYAVLTFDECVYYRKQMIELIEKYK